MQPCREPCGSTVGFDVLSVEVIQVEKKAHLSQRLNLCQWPVTSSRRGKFLDFESTERLQETLTLSLNRRTLLSPYCKIRNVELCCVVLCRTQKYVQEDKRMSARTELDGDI